MMLLPALFSVSQILAEVALLDNAGSGIIYSSVSNGEFAAVLEVAIFGGQVGSCTSPILGRSRAPPIVVRYRT